MRAYRQKHMIIEKKLLKLDILRGQASSIYYNLFSKLLTGLSSRLLD